MPNWVCFALYAVKVSFCYVPTKDDQMADTDPELMNRLIELEHPALAKLA